MSWTDAAPGAAQGEKERRRAAQWRGMLGSDFAVQLPFPLDPCRRSLRPSFRLEHFQAGANADHCLLTFYFYRSRATCAEVYSLLHDLAAPPSFVSLLRLGICLHAACCGSADRSCEEDQCIFSTCDSGDCFVGLLTIFFFVRGHGFQSVTCSSELCRADNLGAFHPIDPSDRTKLTSEFAHIDVNRWVSGDGGMYR
ncbi:hypothetical protein R1flu_018923 [Riccia fluitans]|uniref:Uncharacterized protein n=1 Tax=Riccia fluitans TaxID=41844 RepID=A0ABD1ZIP2_9MARC